jgi:hypothetical protein
MVETFIETIVVEGQVDCASSHRAGVRGVVAASGTALSADQLRLIADTADPLLFDAESRTWTDWYRFSRGYYYADGGGVELMDDWTVQIYQERERDWRSGRPRPSRRRLLAMFGLAPPAPAGRLDAAEVKSSCDMQAVWRELGGEEPRRTGREKMQVKCLIHGERNPSAIINVKSKDFHCYSCSAHHDVFGLVMAVLGCPFRESVKFVNDLWPPRR